MNNIKFFNEDCFTTMNTMVEFDEKVDIILTSPPYNTGRPSTSERSRNNNEGRYDVHLDTMTQDDYCQWCIDLFNNFNKVLNENGVILWNVSYGSDGTVNTESVGLMWLAIADIIRNTPFTVADRIIWKKNSALPNNVSKNKLTRIVEDYLYSVERMNIKHLMPTKKCLVLGKMGRHFIKIILTL